MIREVASAIGDSIIKQFGNRKQYGKTLPTRCASRRLINTHVYLSITKEMHTKLIVSRKEGKSQISHAHTPNLSSLPLPLPSISLLNIAHNVFALLISNAATLCTVFSNQHGCCYVQGLSPFIHTHISLEESPKLIDPCEKSANTPYDALYSEYSSIGLHLANHITYKRHAVCLLTYFTIRGSRV